MDNNIPTTDGVDFILVDRSGVTSLGRDLSPFTIRPFRMGNFSEFNHVLGFTLYLKTGKVVNDFRNLLPKAGLALFDKVEKVDNPTYHYELEIGLRASVFSDVYLVDRLRESTLPFYAKKGKTGKLVTDEITNYYTRLRMSLQASIW